MMEFTGALVLVTHDRYLLDRVSRRLLSLDGKGNARYFADLSQWEDAQADLPDEPMVDAAPIIPEPPEPVTPKRGLSGKELKELKAVEAQLRAAEADCKKAQAALKIPRLPPTPPNSWSARTPSPKPRPPPINSSPAGNPSKADDKNPRPSPRRKPGSRGVSPPASASRPGRGVRSIERLCRRSKPAVAPAGQGFRSRSKRPWRSPPRSSASFLSRGSLSGLKSWISSEVGIPQKPEVVKTCFAAETRLGLSSLKL